MLCWMLTLLTVTALPPVPSGTHQFQAVLLGLPPAQGVRAIPDRLRERGDAYVAMGMNPSGRE